MGNSRIATLGPSAVLPALMACSLTDACVARLFCIGTEFPSAVLKSSWANDQISFGSSVQIGFDDNTNRESTAILKYLFLGVFCTIVTEPCRATEISQREAKPGFHNLT